MVIQMVLEWLVMAFFSIETQKDGPHRKKKLD